MCIDGRRKERLQVARESSTDGRMKKVKGRKESDERPDGREELQEDSE